MKNTTKTNEVKATNEVKINRIDEVLQALELCNKAKIEELNKQEDIDIRRSAIASYVLEVAHENKMLLSFKKTSAFRELLYNLLAIDTKKSKEFHKEQQAKASDTIKDIKDSALASFIFSSMYVRQVKEYLK